jgi:hypothetical protein
LEEPHEQAGSEARSAQRLQGWTDRADDDWDRLAADAIVLDYTTEDNHPGEPVAADDDDAPVEGELLSITFSTEEEAAARARWYGPGTQVRPHDRGFALFAINDDGEST